MIKLLAALAVAASLIAALAQADPVWQVGQDYVVRHQDIDLATPAGQRTLLRRVELAATRLCSGYMLGVDETACRQAVLAETLARSTPAARQALQVAMAEQAARTLASR